MATTNSPLKTLNTTRGNKAYSVIKRRIVTNQISPGNLVDDREIALELNMSRTPVREALLLLQSEGLVEITPRRGTKVVAISRFSMKEYYDIITGLELMAVDLLARRELDAQALKPLSEALDGMRTAQSNDDINACVDADESFHRGLLELCGNSRLTELGLKYRDQIQRAHLVAVRLRPRERIEQSIAAHQSLYDLLLLGDAISAREVHYSQRLDAGREQIETLERYGLDNL